MISSKHRIIVGLGLLAMLLSLFGCSDNATPALPTPIGAANGLNTFIFFFTDN